MNNMLNYYTLKYISHNKKKVLTDVVSIFLCLCSAMVLCIASWSYVSTTKKFELQQNGEQDVVYKNVSENDYNKIRSEKQIKELGEISVFGREKIIGSSFEEYSVIGTFDEKSKALTHIQLIQGNWPQNSNEIVIEKSLQSKLGVKIGETKAFNFSLLQSDITMKFNCKIVGVINDYSSSQGGTDGSQDITETLPNILTVSDSFNQVLGNEKPIKHLLIKLNPNINVSDFSTLYSNWTNGGKAQYYSQYVAVIGQSGVTIDYANTNKLSTNYIYIILISVSLFVIIFSLIFNSKINRTRNYKDIKKLKLSGATVKNILNFFLLRETYCYLFALPFAVLTSIGLLMFFQNKILSSFWEIFTLDLNIPIILLIILTIYILLIFLTIVSINKKLNLKPLVCENKDDNYNALQNKTFSIKSPELLWSIKSLIKNKKTFRSNTFLLSLCVMLIILSSVLSTALIRDLKEDYSLDYRMEEYDGSFVSLIEIPLNLNYGVSQRDLDKFKSNNEIRFLSAVKQFRCKIVTDTKAGYPGNGFFMDDFVGNDRSQFNAEKNKMGYDENEYLAPFSVFGVDEAILNLLKPYIVDGSFDLKGLNNGNKVIAVYDSLKLPFKAGDNVTVTQNILDSKDFNQENFSAKRYDKQFEICAIIDTSKIKDEKLLEMCRYINGFVMLNDAFKVLPFETNYSNIFVSLNDPNIFEKTDKTFNDLKSIYPNSLLISKRSEAVRLELLTTVTKIILQIVNTVIGFFAFFSLYNVAQKKLQEQKRTIALLRSMGFSFSKAFYSIYFEFILLSFICVIIGFLLSFPINAYFNLSNIVGTYPWYLILLSLILLCIITLIITLISLIPIYKKSIIELLSHE